MKYAILLLDTKLIAGIGCLLHLNWDRHMIGNCHIRQEGVCQPTKISRCTCSSFFRSHHPLDGVCVALPIPLHAFRCVFHTTFLDYDIQNVSPTWCFFCQIPPDHQSLVKIVSILQACCCWLGTGRKSIKCHGQVSASLCECLSKFAMWNEQEPVYFSLSCWKIENWIPVQNVHIWLLPVGCFGWILVNHHQNHPLSLMASHCPTNTYSDAEISMIAVLGMLDFKKESFKMSRVLCGKASSVKGFSRLSMSGQISWVGTRCGVNTGLAGLLTGIVLQVYDPVMPHQVVSQSLLIWLVLLLLVQQISKTNSGILLSHVGAAGWAYWRCLPQMYLRCRFHSCMYLSDDHDIDCLLHSWTSPWMTCAAITWGLSSVW